jgi:putative glutamine amidotransferase
MPALRPLIGISACVKAVRGEDLAFHAVPEPYVDAVRRGAEAEAVLLPAVGAPDESLLARLDGLLLTGSKSNLRPEHYGGAPDGPGPHDPRRDATTLPAVARAIAAGLPLFAICRGFQELNVALGGTLHQRVHDVGGMADHRSSGAPDQAFAPRHPVRLVEGGLLARLAGPGEVMVNSSHGQGIDRLAPGLAVEAVASDGLVEAVRVEGAAAFAIGVQWHPEWRFERDPLSCALWRAFGDAARRRALRSHVIHA